MRSHVIKIIEPCAKTSLYLVVEEDANQYDWKIFGMDNEVGQFFSFSSTSYHLRKYFDQRREIT